MQSNREIIIKVVSGNASESEMNELQSWRKLSEENEKEYQSVLNLWQDIAEAKEEITPDEELAWNQFLGKTESIKSARPLTMYRMVAGVVLVALLSVIVKFAFFNSTEKPVAVIPVKKEVIKEAIPEYSIITVTSKDSIRQIILPDNSFILLNKNSEFTYYAYNNGTFANCTLNGEAYFNIVPSEEGFTVSTNNILVKVLGTSFNILENKKLGITEVYVEKGKVEISSKSNSEKKLLLSANQRGKFDTKKQDFVTRKKTVVATPEEAVENISTPAKKHWWTKLKEKINKAFGKKKKEEENER